MSFCQHQWLSPRPQPFCAVGVGQQNACPLEAILFWCEPHHQGTSPSASLLSKGIRSLVGSPANVFPRPLYGGPNYQGGSWFAIGCPPVQSLRHCGSEVDALATHGLSCRQSQGCHHQHAAINNIIHRSPVSSNVLSKAQSTTSQALLSRVLNFLIVPLNSRPGYSFINHCSSG